MIEDLSVFFDEDDFAAIALIDGGEVRGIFESPVEGVALGRTGTRATGSLDVDLALPFFLTAAEWVPNIKKDDPVEVAGQVYSLAADPQPDGAGLVLLELAPPQAPPSTNSDWR
ncbi:MAG: hypothetical protein M3H12_08875 [Chromatiales bacterium]|nr:hypothetical protein [Gammaproteobacteria bacterium]